MSRTFASTRVRRKPRLWCSWTGEQELFSHGKARNGWKENQTANDQHRKKRYPCKDPECGPEVVFTRSTDLRRHQDSKHGRRRDFPCPVKNCERVGERAFARKDHLVEHLRQYHGVAVKKREPGQRRGPGIPPVQD